MSSDGGSRAEAKNRWDLTGEALERLLAALDPNRDRAAVAYEQLRHRTIGLLRWWGAWRPEELADQTLDRVARKLADGTPIGQGSLGAYVRGVARMVFYESGRERVAPLTGREIAPPPRPGDLEAASECLDHCLATLAASDRSLLIRYYGAGKAADVRRQLAGELGISLTALRIRTHRLRAPVERCVTACLARKNFL